MIPLIRQLLSRVLASLSDWALIASLRVGGYADKQQVDELKVEVRRALREGW